MSSRWPSTSTVSSSWIYRLGNFVVQDISNLATTSYNFCAFFFRLGGFFISKCSTTLKFCGYFSFAKCSITFSLFLLCFKFLSSITYFYTIILEPICYLACSLFYCNWHLPKPKYLLGNLETKDRIIWKYNIL